jgi:hypothetical protein
MRLFEQILDILGYILIKLKELLVYIFRLLLDLAGRLYEKFLDVSMPEKIIFLNTLPAFLAVIFPVAKFYIFESYFNVNNPLSVYMIAIAGLMFISVYYPTSLVFYGRLFINSYYLFWIIYIQLANQITKADPHVIAAGYYLNIIVPVIYILASIASRMGRG